MYVYVHVAVFLAAEYADLKLTIYLVILLILLVGIVLVASHTQLGLEYCSC